MPPNTATEMLIESHEERLQRVEEKVSDINANVEVLSSKIDGYHEVVEKRLESHIEDDVAVKASFENFSEKIGQMEAKLDSIEAKRKHNQARKDMLLKALIGLLFGLAGAGGKMLLDHLLKGG